MPGDGSAKFPSKLHGKRLGIAIEFAAGDLRMVVEILLACGEGVADILLELVFAGVGAKNERSAKVRLPLLEDRAQIEEENVVGANGQLGRVFRIGLQSVAP